MLLCITDSADLTPVHEYCQRTNLYHNCLSLSEENMSIKAALEKTRTLANYDFILFYFVALTPEICRELTKAVKHTRRYYHARILVFAPESPLSLQLFGVLADEGLRELAAVNEQTDLAVELEECLSKNGKSFASAADLQVAAQIEQTRSNIRPEFIIPDGLILEIGIAGAQPRTGVTTQAFSLYHAFQSLGFAPCIVDVRQRLLPILMTLYGDELKQDEAMVKIKSIDFVRNEQEAAPETDSRNVFLYDFGELSEEMSERFGSCDYRILCAGAKPWELPLFAQKEEMYGKLLDMVLFSFASEQEKEMVKSIGLPYHTEYPSWNPDIWKCAELDWYKKLLLPFLKERFPS